jgi:hypothetical protein
MSVTCAPVVPVSLSSFSTYNGCSKTLATMPAIDPNKMSLEARLSLVDDVASGSSGEWILYRSAHLWAAKVTTLEDACACEEAFIVGYGAGLVEKRAERLQLSHLEKMQREKKKIQQLNVSKNSPNRKHV